MLEESKKAKLESALDTMDMFQLETKVVKIEKKPDAEVFGTEKSDSSSFAGEYIVESENNENPIIPLVEQNEESNNPGMVHDSSQEAI